MIGIGGCVGYAWASCLVRPYMKRLIQHNMLVASEGDSPGISLVVHKERWLYMASIGCVMGAAAGIATAFNSPMGGILYLFEEVTVTNWAPELTFRTFCCSVLATFFARLLLHFFGGEVHQLLIYNEETNNSLAVFAALDVLLMTFVAGLVGVISVIY